MDEQPRNKAIAPARDRRECGKCGSGRVETLDAVTTRSTHCRDCGDAVLSDRSGRVLATKQDAVHG